jgi:hypothetical protein
LGARGQHDLPLEALLDDFTATALEVRRASL